MEKAAKNSSLERHRSKILIAVSIMFMLFFMNSVSAFDFDNVKSYDTNSDTVTITNAFGLPFISSTIATVKLDTPHINYVASGSDVKIAQVTCFASDLKNCIPESFEFRNVRRGGDLMEKTINLKYLTYEKVAVNDYDPSLEILKNGTKIPSTKIIGTHYENKEVWNDLKDPSLLKDNVTIGFFTDIKVGDKIEWIPTISGVKVQEWALVYQAIVFPSDTGAECSGKCGVKISVVRDSRIVNVTKYATSPQTNAFVSVRTGTGIDNSVVIGSATFSGTTATFSPPVEVNTSYLYFVWSYANGTMRIAFLTYPYASSDISVDSSAREGNEFGGQVEGISSIYTSTGAADVIPTITLINPIDKQNFTTHSVTFATLPYDPDNATGLNVSIYGNWSGSWALNVSNASAYNNTQTNFTITGIPDGQYIWNSQINDSSNGTAYFSSANRSFTIDTTSPTVNVANFTDSFVVNSLPSNLIWNYTANDQHIQACYYNTSDSASYSIVTCNATISTAFATEGNKTIQYCANDTFGFETCRSGYSDVVLLTINQTDNPDPVGEGNNEKITLNVSRTSALPTTTATLFLNHTLYSADVINTSTNWAYFEVNTMIPLGWGNTTGRNVSWFWNYTVSGLTTNTSTTTNNLTVYSLAIDNCSTYGDPILNMSLKDEASATFVNGSAGSDIEIDLQITSRTNSSFYQQFNGTYTNVSYAAVCVPSGLLTGSQYRIDVVSEYSSTGRTVEFFYLDNGTLNSSAYLDQFTNKTTSIYDLLLTDSTTFLFSFLDEDSVKVPDAIVHVFRQFIGDGLFREVERGKQDNNGETHLHLVEEDVIYFFKVSLDGELLFTSSTYNAKCLSSPCQIELSSSSANPQFDTNFTTTDGTYSITTYPSQRMVALTFSLPNPSLMNLTIAKQNYTGGLTIVNTSSVTSTGSTINLSMPLSAGNVTFYAIVYKDGVYVSSRPLNLQDKASNYFGTTGLIMASLMILALVLMAIFEGAGVIVFLILGLVVASAMTILDLGYYSLVGLICALIILIFKLVQKRR